MEVFLVPGMGFPLVIIVFFIGCFLYGVVYNLKVLCTRLLKAARSNTTIIDTANGDGKLRVKPSYFNQPEFKDSVTALTEEDQK